MSMRASIRLVMMGILAVATAAPPQHAHAQTTSLLRLSKVGTMSRGVAPLAGALSGGEAAVGALLLKNGDVVALLLAVKYDAVDLATIEALSEQGVQIAQLRPFLGLVPDPIAPTGTGDTPTARICGADEPDGELVTLVETLGVVGARGENLIVARTVVPSREDRALISRARSLLTGYFTIGKDPTQEDLAMVGRVIAHTGFPILDRGTLKTRLFDALAYDVLSPELTQLVEADPILAGVLRGYRAGILDPIDFDAEAVLVSSDFFHETVEYRDESGTLLYRYHHRTRRKHHHWYWYRPSDGQPIRYQYRNEWEGGS